MKVNKPVITPDFSNHRILIDNRPLYLTKTENIILSLLYENKDNVVTFEELCKAVYNISLDKSAKATIARHICALKKKVRRYIRIETIRGEGYIIEEEFKGV